MLFHCILRVSKYCLMVFTDVFEVHGVCFQLVFQPFWFCCACHKMITLDDDSTANKCKVTDNEMHASVGVAVDTTLQVGF